jgi:allantoin racemase
VSDLPGVPTNLESRINEHYAIDIMIANYKNGFFNDFNAIGVGCFYDPGVTILREIMDIPVIGAGEASLKLASCLGSRIGLIVGKERWLPQIMDNARLYGLEKYIFGWEELKRGVNDFHNSIEEITEEVISVGQKLKKIKNCDVIVLGCTALEEIHKKVSIKLNLPVIDASIATFKFAEMLSSLNEKIGIKTSKFLTYAN